MFWCFKQLRGTNKLKQLNEVGCLEIVNDKYFKSEKNEFSFNKLFFSYRQRMKYISTYVFQY